MCFGSTTMKGLNCPSLYKKEEVPCWVRSNRLFQRHPHLQLLLHRPFLRRLCSILAHAVGRPLPQPLRRKKPSPPRRRHRPFLRRGLCRVRLRRTRVPGWPGACTPMSRRPGSEAASPSGTLALARCLHAYVEKAGFVSVPLWHGLSPSI
ncbi:60S ribosomal protein L7a-1 [Iris pallida]|uniref:60S ribosomal protein L7a-1 n=1 Tax=Iris pallida TaxID=29817 RepID=A0AAX6GUI9_IRIPA|nr:60S ribosomal protein L7a-1 [Iris pallida]